MLRKLRPRSIYDVFALLALIVAVGGTSAYAANTVFSTDIVDGEVKSADVKDQSLTTFDVSTFLGADVVDGTLTGDDIQDNSVSFLDIGSQQVGSDEVVNDSLLQSDIRAGAVTGDEVLDGSLTGFDIQNGQIGQVDIADTAINSAKVADNSLTGTDINESTLSPTTTATFAGSGFVDLNDDSTLTKVVGKTLPAGSYAITATANIHGVIEGSFEESDRDTSCELRNGTGFIGGAGPDRRRTHSNQHTSISLSMNGGAQVPAGGGEVSLWCSYQNFGGTITNSQMMIIRLDGFF